MIVSREDVVQWVRSFVGLSERNDPNGDLARLVTFPGDKDDSHVHTNCAMFACGIMRQLGCGHRLLNHNYVNGMALVWLLEIARETGSLYLPNDNGPPSLGDLLHWATAPVPGQPPRNNDHVAFVTEMEKERGRVRWVAGGAENNLITESPHFASPNANQGRPLRHIIDTIGILCETQ